MKTKQRYGLKRGKVPIPVHYPNYPYPMRILEGLPPSGQQPFKVLL